MKRFFLFLSLFFIVISVFAQSSPLKMVNFHKLPNEIVDLKALKDEVGRDTDLDGNKAALVRVKALGFSEKTILDFSCYTRGVEMIVQKHKNGEWWWYLGSNTQGSVIIKYMGEYEFKLPNKLEAKAVYELVLGMETATLVIRTNPKNADIFVDNEKIGAGYASKAVSLGAEHRYKVQCENYWPKEGLVYFEKREEKQIDIELEPNFGYITIKTEPSGADIYIDGKKVGVTPYLSEMIEFGRRRVELKKSGYEQYVKVVTIKADEEENTQLANVKLIEDKNAPQQPVPTTPVAGNTNTSVNNNSSNGVFSVASGRKVQFSKGNLQYQASTNTWRFAEHQWDVIGDANKNISSSYSGWIDLFGWGTSGYNGKNPWMTSTTSTNYGDGERDIAGTNYDWGVNNTILNGGGKSWRTLTRDEWVYVFNTRSTSSGIRYAKATVNGVNGVILLPDNWSSSNYSLSNTNKTDVGFSSNRISQTDWQNKFESNGAVFLPAAGYRIGTNVYSVGSGGYYWSASYNSSSSARDVWFSDGILGPDSWLYRYDGFSVRLVCSAQ